jgi:peptide deformylase
LGYFDPFGDRFIWIVLTYSGTGLFRSFWTIGDCPQSVHFETVGDRLKLCNIYTSGWAYEEGKAIMAIHPIREYGDPVLRKKALPVDKITRRTQKIIKDMIDTLHDAEGAGLAAPQIGLSERIIVVDIGDGPIALINPRLLKAEGSQRDVEGCLSFPGISGYVTRKDDIVVEGLNENGKIVRIEAKGFLSRAFQHEIDHLDGKLFIDYLPQDKTYTRTGNPS